MRLTDLTGERFGRLTVVERNGKLSPVQWRCICDCGSKSRSVHANALVHGLSKSCGCVRTEMLTRPKVQLVCAACGEPFSVAGKITRQCAKQGRKRLFCSFACKHIGHRKDHFNERFFETFTEASAYWLGFLWADGHITKNRLSITLAAQDKTHLQKLANALESKAAVVDKINKGGAKMTARVVFHSVTLTKPLIARGLLATTKRLYDFSDMPVELRHHFWRGMFDGDGSLNKSRSGIAFELANTPEMIQAAREFFGDGQTRVHSGNRRTWVFRAMGNQKPLRFAARIYQGATVFLDRKRAIYDSLLAHA